MFNKNPKIVLNDKLLDMFLNGVKLKFDEFDGIYRVYDKNNSFIGLGVMDKKELKRDIII